MSTAPRAQDTAPEFSLATLRAALAEFEPQYGARAVRAASIVACRHINPWGPGYLVESECEPERYYLVSRDAFGTRCMCQDYLRRKLDCKHILATRLLTRCECLAAEFERAPLPFPVPTLDLDAPIPFELTPLADAALAYMPPA